MKILILILSLLSVAQLKAQQLETAQNSNSDSVTIYSSAYLINIAKHKGINELKNLINPIDLVYLDSAYAPKLIDLEFKSGFLGRHFDNDKIITYELPELTLAIADDFDYKKADKKLFDYYCSIPKFIRSDTLYYIYNNLDHYLEVLIKVNPAGLIEKLKKDYNEWTKLALKAPKKIYPTIEERQKMPFMESIKFKPSNLYPDCNFLVLQLAGALNYLNVKGFDNLLLENLKTRQTMPYLKSYSFPKPFFMGSKTNNSSRTIIQNKTKITGFRKDIKKLEQIFFGNFEYGSGSKLIKIIENGSKACLSFSRNNGSAFYLVTLKTDNTIAVDLLYSVIE